jgi:hypothetical protein
MGHYTVPRAQLVAHLYQHEMERWKIRRDRYQTAYAGPVDYEFHHPKPPPRSLDGTKRATLDALHDAFHRFHAREVNHTHPEGLEFLHLIFEDAPDGIPIYLQRGEAL